jgi:hypothetical protein
MSQEEIRETTVGSQLLRTGVLTTLRRLFAKIRVSECHRDFSPLTLSELKLWRGRSGGNDPTNITVSHPSTLGNLGAII